MTNAAGMSTQGASPCIRTSRTNNKMHIFDHALLTNKVENRKKSNNFENSNCKTKLKKRHDDKKPYAFASNQQKGSVSQLILHAKGINEMLNKQKVDNDSEADKYVDNCNKEESNGRLLKRKLNNTIGKIENVEVLKLRKSSDACRSAQNSKNKKKRKNNRRDTYTYIDNNKILKEVYKTKSQISREENDDNSEESNKGIHHGDSIIKLVKDLLNKNENVLSKNEMDNNMASVKSFKCKLSKLNTQGCVEHLNSGKEENAVCINHININRNTSNLDKGMNIVDNKMMYNRLDKETVMPWGGCRSMETERTYIQVERRSVSEGHLNKNQSLKIRSFEDHMIISRSFEKDTNMEMRWSQPRFKASPHPRDVPLPSVLFGQPICSY